jgi:hypothetical protein
MALSRLDEPLDQENERLQLSPNERNGFIDRDPAPPPQPRFQPIVQDPGHTHQVDFDHICFIRTRKVVAAERLAFQIAN